MIQQAEYTNLMEYDKYNISDSRIFTDPSRTAVKSSGDVTESGYITEPSYGVTEPESLAHITSKMDPSNFITRILSCPR